MFGDGVVIADSPKDFQDKVDYYLKNEDERIAIAKKGQEFVIENHTGFHRVAQILNEFGHSEISMDLLKQYKEAVHA